MWRLSAKSILEQHWQPCSELWYGRHNAKHPPKPHLNEEKQYSIALIPNTKFEKFHKTFVKKNQQICNTAHTILACLQQGMEVQEILEIK